MMKNFIALFLILNLAMLACSNDNEVTPTSESTLNSSINVADIQVQAGKLGAELEKNEADTFAGLWIENNYPDDYRVMVAFTANGETTIKKYITEGNQLANVIHLRTAEVSLAQLLSDWHEIEAVFDDAGIKCPSELNLPENNIELYTLDIEETYAFLREAQIQLPEHIVVVQVQNLGSFS